MGSQRRERKTTSQEGAQDVDVRRKRRYRKLGIPQSLRYTSKTLQIHPEKHELE